MREIFGLQRLTNQEATDIEFLHWWLNPETAKSPARAGTYGHIKTVTNDIK
jgi:hypothetical protein